MVTDASGLPLGFDALGSGRSSSSFGGRGDQVGGDENILGMKLWPLGLRCWDPLEPECAEDVAGAPGDWRERGRRAGSFAVRWSSTRSTRVRRKRSFPCQAKPWRTACGCPVRGPVVPAVAVT
ncbi:unnamed protein product [Lota lota]